MKTTKKIHYVYRITNLNPTDERLYYIGVRSTSKASAELDTYMGSSKYLKEDMKEIGVENFKKEILSEWKTRKLAVEEEIRLHNKFDVAKNPLFYNRSKQTSIGFDTTGYIAVIDNRDGKTKSVSKEEYNRFDYYNGCALGMVNVVDTRTNTNKRVTKEEYNNFDYYVSVTIGKVTVIDVRDNKTKTVTKEEYAANDFYISPSLNKVSVTDKKNGKILRISKEDFKQSTDLEFHTKNKVVAYDDKGVKHLVSKSEYKNNTNLKHTATNTVVARNKITGEKTRIPKELFDSSDDWISLNVELGLANIIHVFNKDNELVKIYNGDFDPMCRNDKLPYAELTRSYKSNGDYKIYPQITDGTAAKCMISRLNNNGNIQYAGWYAKISK